MIKVVLKLGCHAGAAERSKRRGRGAEAGGRDEWRGGVGVFDKEYLS